MTTPEYLFASDHNAVKTRVCSTFEELLDRLWTLAEADERPRALELAVWKEMLGLCRLVLSALFAAICRRCTVRDLQRRGLSREQVTLRMDEDYWGKQSTTFGTVRFPFVAYRERRGAATITRTPARRELFPMYSRCRSSELCVEWEARLGSEFPFRKAERMLSVFTHGAVTLEDTTIASHMVAVGSAIDRGWLYRPVEQIRDILENRATRDTETGRPIMYLSTDAHALRRYVDDTWDAAWKMANGIRVWCVDRRTGSTIHLGGEYTWGDCKHVGAIIDDLIERGVLPKEGDYGDGLVAVHVVVADGMPWIEDHLLSRLPWAQAVLDIYHALEHLAEFAAACFGRAKRKKSHWYKRVARLFLGKKRRKSARQLRRGHRKRRKSERISPPSPSVESGPERNPAQAVIMELYCVWDELRTVAQYEAFDSAVAYFNHNSYRMDYFRYRNRGFQVGSGAMESLHRTASQLRLKIPGPGCLAETAQAVFNLRMLAMVDRWDEFWAHPNASVLLAEAFNARFRRDIEV